MNESISNERDSYCFARGSADYHHYADSLCMVQGPVALHKQSFIVKVRSQIKAGPLFEKLACFIIGHYGLILSFFLLFLIPKDRHYSQPFVRLKWQSCQKTNDKKWRKRKASWQNHSFYSFSITTYTQQVRIKFWKRGVVHLEFYSYSTRRCYWKQTLSLSFLDMRAALYTLCTCADLCTCVYIRVCVHASPQHSNPCYL